MMKRILGLLRKEFEKPKQINLAEAPGFIYF